MDFIYKGLRGTLEKITVTDAEVQEQIKKLQQQNLKTTPVLDRPAQAGDELVLDYAGFVGTEQFAGGTAQNQTLTLGSGMFIPGFEEQLIGANAGEQVTVKVTFPADYHAKELAGKEAEFCCTVHEIRKRTPYELDDTFAKEVGGVENMQAFEAEMRRSMQAYFDDRSELELQDKLMRQAAMTLDFHPSREALEAALDAQMQSMQAQLAQRGLSLEMYCQFSGTTMEKLREDLRGEAENSLRIQSTAEAIADLEKLEASEEDLQAEYALICRQNGITMEQLRPHLNEEFIEAAKRSVRMQKAMDLVRKNAVITERQAAPKKQ